ncbi:MAG: hypothetical protein N2258_03470 [Brevinematales bacterium]|nr:hypothetical protein [Brevinematales bacterium]
MRKILVLVFLLISYSFAFESKFLNLSTNDIEYNIVKDTDKYPLKISTLIASKVKNISNYIEKINNFEVFVSNKFSTDRLRNAKIIFDEMHKNFLKKYGVNYYFLDELIDRGFFNCMSATAFYSILLEDFGYEFKAIGLPTHIFTLLLLDGREIDIENTSPYGFDIRTNLSAQESFRRLTGFNYTRDTNLVEIFDKKGILASLYANIAAIELNKKNYESAFQNVVKAYMIYPYMTLIKTNTVTIYFEYCLYLERLKEYEKALEVCEEGMLISENSFLNLYYNITMNYLTYLLGKGEDKKAFQFLKNKEKKYNFPLEIKENYYFYLIERERNNYDKMYNILLEAIVELKESKNLNKLIYNVMYFLIENKYDREDDFLRIYNFVKNDLDAREYLSSYYETIGVEYLKKKEYDRLIDLRERSRKYLISKELDSMVIDVYSIRAKGEIENKEFEKAEKNLITALNIDNKNSRAISNLLNFYRFVVGELINKKDYKRANSFLENGLNYFPKDKKLLEYKEFLKKYL